MRLVPFNTSELQIVRVEAAELESQCGVLDLSVCENNVLQSLLKEVKVLPKLRFP